MASRKITDLYKPLQPIITEFIKRIQFNNAKGFITCTLRTKEEQNELYAQGRTKPGKIITWAKGGESLHNYGLAVDIAFKDNHNNLIWDLQFFRLAGREGRKLGLEWGGDWVRFKDYPHFQYTGGLRIKDLQKGKMPVIIK